MSVADILAELPRHPDELDMVIEKTMELHQRAKFVASPELLQAIDEADATPEDQDITIKEAFRVAKSWNTR